MIKNKSLAKAIANQGWGEIGRQLAYKSSKQNRLLIKADLFFASSKLCLQCGSKKTNLTLNNRTYVCDNCTNVLNRGINAAINLAIWGEHHLELCACHKDDETQIRSPHVASRSDVKHHACAGWVSGKAKAALPVLSSEARTSQLR